MATYILQEVTIDAEEITNVAADQRFRRVDQGTDRERYVMTTKLPGGADGPEQVVRNGDYIVTNPNGESGPVQRAEFERVVAERYRQIDTNPAP